MNQFLKIALLLAVIGGGLAVTPAASQAQDYWNSYWGWYDNTYRPYYHRQYSYRPYTDYGYWEPYGSYK